jgi:histidine triad (HIT) family protein
MDCIFCKIVAGNIPSIKVYEDAHTLAFMDINPLTPGHLLVVPKPHFVNLFDIEEGVLLQTMAAVRKVALGQRQALGLDSLNLVQANGRWATQSVPHLHFHLVPRRENDHAPLDWQLKPGNMDAIRRDGQRIAAALQ